MHRLRPPTRLTIRKLLRLQELEVHKFGLLTEGSKDGTRLWPMGINGAVRPEDMDELANRPLPLRCDSNGRLPLDEATKLGLRVRPGSDPGYVRESPRLPHSWEEWSERWGNLEKKTEYRFTNSAYKHIPLMIQAHHRKDDLRVLRTFAYAHPEGGPQTSIMLVGVTKWSMRSRQLAARVVYEAEPTGLLLQLCRERLGRHLVMPEEHITTLADYERSYLSGNVEKWDRVAMESRKMKYDLEGMQRWFGDMAHPTALQEFLQLPKGKSRVVCLGDVLQSRLKSLEDQHGAKALEQTATMSARGKQLARGILALAEAGHETVVGVVDADLMPQVTTWLERGGATFVAAADASDIDASRETIAGDIELGRTTRVNRREGANPSVLGRARLGTFINEKGLDFLETKRKRLLRFTRVKDLVRHDEENPKWTVATNIGMSLPVSPPGPEALVNLPKYTSHRFHPHLEVPGEYLREAGAFSYHKELWQALLDAGGAAETADISELQWWSAGALDVNAGEVEVMA